MLPIIHCCTDCDADNHTALCGYQQQPLSDTLVNFLRLPVSERCLECYEAINPLKILNIVEL